MKKNIVRIVCVSDTHGIHQDIKKKFEIPDGDILIHAGDVSNVGEEYDVKQFLDWFVMKKPHSKVFIAGNHDFLFQDERIIARELVEERQKRWDLHYLEDSSTTIEGLKIWGSPVTPPFMNWAFNRKDSKIVMHWEYMALDSDIIVTHGPPNGILDFSKFGYEHCGCPYLRKRIFEIEPLVHIFGHVHGEYGVKVEDGITFINASTLNERYKVTNKPIVIDVDKENRLVEIVDY
jgi:Icc-related predicted phosphoesterase